MSDKKHRPFKLVALLFVFIVIGLVGSTLYNNVQGDMVKAEMEGLGATVYTGVEIESPSIIFNVRDYREFKSLYKEHGPKVYRVFRVYFYLFTEDYQIAYRFTIYPWNAIEGIKGLDTR